MATTKPSQKLDVNRIDLSQLTPEQFEELYKRTQTENNSRKKQNRAHRKIISETWREIKEQAGDLNDDFYEGEAAFVAAAKTLYGELHKKLTVVPEGADGSIEEGVREYQRKAPERAERGRKISATRAKNKAKEEAQTEAEKSKHES